MTNTWNTPVLEELSIPRGTYGSTDDNGASVPDFGAPPDPGLTVS